MNFRLIVPIAALSLTGCKPVACMFSYVTGDSGGCTLPAKPTCTDGQLPSHTGECRAPFGYEVDDGDGGGGDDSGGDPPGDTSEPLDSGDGGDFGPCDYRVVLVVDDFPEEYGFDIRRGGTSYLSKVPGDITGDFSTSVWPLTLPDADGYAMLLFDDYGDGWGSGNISIYRQLTDHLIAAGTVTGELNTIEFDITCNE